jgi:heme oxygenase
LINHQNQSPYNEHDAIKKADLNQDIQNLPLSHLLRESTAQAHHDAESSSFIGLLFQGKVTPKSYYWYLQAMLKVYTALEDQLTRNQDHPVIALIFIRGLFRVEALHKDLVYWDFAKSELPESVANAVQDYVLRIEGVSNKRPELLVAHSYVRYLGDLSGGQALAHAMSKSGVPKERLNFYDFGDINKVQFKNFYRSQLDLIGNQFPKLKVPICDEANLVFKLNTNVFKAFDASEN